MPPLTMGKVSCFAALANRRVMTLLACAMIHAAHAHHAPGQIEYEPIELSTAAHSPATTETIIPSNNIEATEIAAAPTSNQMLWQQYQALQAGGGSDAGACQSCGGGYSDYDRCGCNTGLFHWIDGPGNCDQWCVGPKWGVDAGGLFLFREDANWAGVIADIGAPDPVLVDQFEHGPGARVFVTGYNDQGWGIQVGYEGINDWDASLGYAPVGAAPTETTRNIGYQSRLNSLEVNFLRRTPSPWEFFSGFRYVQLDEDFLDVNTTDKPIPPPSFMPVSTAFVDTEFNRILENRLIGFQLGTRRDAWQFGTRFTVHTFANAGVYCNKFRREEVDVTETTVITGDDLATVEDEFTTTNSRSVTKTRRDFADIAFVGEAGLTGTLRINQCTALRAGYQILALDGVSQGLDAFLSPNAGLDSSTLVFHGLQFGLEYRR
ncbi:MAG: BBP7 family outer membrane beta-barrel protein [Planctomycetota bacterium]